MMLMLESDSNLNSVRKSYLIVINRPLFIDNKKIITRRMMCLSFDNETKLSCRNKWIIVHCFLINGCTAFTIQTIILDIIKGMDIACGQTVFIPYLNIYRTVISYSSGLIMA